jgi:hypothetical protein
MTPTEIPDRDSTVPPVVTITETPTGFEVLESGVVHSLEPTYELAAQSAHAIFGEDVPITFTGPSAAPTPPPPTSPFPA